jgi:hypothetical protein
VAGRVVLAGKDGDDAKRYQEAMMSSALEHVREALEEGR